MKNCKLNADKKVCDNLEEKQFSFYYSLVEFQILDCFCY